MTNPADVYDDFLDDGNHRWRKRAIGLTLIAALVLGGFLALWATVFRSGGSAESAVQTATVQRGNIMKTISTSAIAASQSTANLSFGSSGRVTAVNVAVGQEVKQGDVLAEIDASSLQNALTRAQVNLLSAQNKLNQLLEGSTAAELASVDQSIIQAQENLDKANQAMQDLYSPASDAVNSAQQAVLSAQSQLTKAQQARADVGTNWNDAHDTAIAALEKAERTEDDAKDAQDDAEDAYNTCLDNNEDETLCTTQKNAYSGAKTAYENAQDAVDMAETTLSKLGSGPDANDIAIADMAVQSAQLALQSANDKLAALGNPSGDDANQAQQAIDSANAALTAAEAKRDETYQGSKPEDISAQQDQVRLAQISIDEAKKDLEKAQIVAPFDGTVSALNITVGDQAGTGSASSSSSSSASIVLNTPNAVVLSLSIGESDLPDVKAGQNGTAVFDALSGQIFPIVIDSVGTNPTTTQGVVTYQAKARILDAASVRLMIGSGATSGQSGQAPPAAQTPSASQSPSATDSTAASAKPVPGMNATVTIIVDQAQNVLMVPSSTVQSDGPNNVVDIQNDDGSTTRQTVETGLTNGTSTEIRNGLEEGQMIIIPGATTSSSNSSSQTGQNRFFSDSFEGGGPPGGGIIQQNGGGSTR
jgi:multidrug resistance efflux pump